MCQSIYIPICGDIHVRCICIGMVCHSPLVAEWLGHAKMDTTRRFYANADTTMKKEAIEKATSDFNPLFSNEYDIDWEDDEDLLKKLYGLK